MQRAYYGWASCCAPIVGALAGLVPLPRPELVARVVIGVAFASLAGVACALVAIKRRERPWWLWAIGLALNAYPFLALLLGVSVLLGITHIHM